MQLQTEKYITQRERWPRQGRHILAHFDDASIVVYQAYSPAIARYAIEHRCFGGDHFSYRRMSWIKPNFLWMMYRSGWGTKEGQEVVLGLRISRVFFDHLLSEAVASSFDAESGQSQSQWERAVESSDVRLQWDPDHDPHGTKQARRAIQLGLRGRTLEAFGKQEILDVIDMSDFIAAQRQVLERGLDRLMIPVEQVYRPASKAVAENVGLSMSEVY